MLKVLHSKRVVLPNGIQEAWVLVENGKITGVLTIAPDNIAIESFGNSILMPGVIDPHVHINEPGRAEWEGFDSATKAAIAGGITTLVDMPLNSAPVTTTASAFDAKVAASNGQLHTNVGLWGGIIPGNANEIEPLIKKGVLGFKAFLTHSGIDDFPNATEADLIKAMPIIATYNLPLLVHCELAESDVSAELSTPLHPDDITTNSTQSQHNNSVTSMVGVSTPMVGVFTDHNNESNSSARSYNNYLQSRPKKWEDDAIAMMIRLCEQFNCRVHIVHLSSANSLAQIAAAREKGLPLTVETGQHYLYFSAEQIKDGQTQFKCAPPIREKENNDQLWAALKDGLIDLVATDHSPATPDLKETGSGDFMKAWGGIASIQFALPVLWTAAKEHGCSFTDIVQWLCEKPAVLIGKQHCKGSIATGFDADFAVVNDEASFVVREEDFHHKHKISPYLNERLFGVVEYTFLGGRKVYDSGTFIQLNNGTILVNDLLETQRNA